MKKVNLTQEEQEKLDILAELNHKYQMGKLEYEKELSNFWFEFQSRKGGGAYSFSLKERCVYELDEKEAREYNKK